MTAQHIRVDQEWRRKLRIWLAENDHRGVSDIAAVAVQRFLVADHADSVYVSPPSGTPSISFDIPAGLHRHVARTVPHLWGHGIRSRRDFYLVALDQYMCAGAEVVSSGPTPRIDQHQQ